MPAIPPKPPVASVSPLMIVQSLATIGADVNYDDLPVLDGREVAQFLMDTQCEQALWPKVNFPQEIKLAYKDMLEHVIFSEELKHYTQAEILDRTESFEKNYREASSAIRTEWGLIELSIYHSDDDEIGGSYSVTIYAEDGYLFLDTLYEFSEYIEIFLENELDVYGEDMENFLSVRETPGISACQVTCTYYPEIDGSEERCKKKLSKSLAEIFANGKVDSILENAFHETVYDTLFFDEE